MTDKNKVRITCDPYTNKIEYKYFDRESEEWNEVIEESILSDDKFKNTSLQNVAYEIVDEFTKKYNPGTTGLNIVFEGTVEDYEYLDGIINSYFNDYGIELTRGTYYFLSAKDAKEEIENIFKNVSKKLDNCPNEKVTEHIKKYTETVRSTVPICVIGLYSAGKSAFINALLGIELLPSASDPTTAKTYSISLGKKNEIRFKWLKNENENVSISLSFDKDTYKISSPETIQLVKKLNEIKVYDTIEKRMYHAIKIINEYDLNENINAEKGQEKLSISDLIEIEIDRKASGSGVLYSDNYDFVIYDTPGSNSASNKPHTDVLKDAMKSQTNGLPIYVTEPDAMDNKDNKELINIFKELGGALDKNNLMIVVNQADKKSPKTLSEKKDNYEKLCISKLNPAGTYFVSSPVAIGCKKLLSGNTLTDEDEQLIPNFIDDDYEYTFEKNIRNFEDGKAKIFLQLYTYNIVPKKQFDDYIKLSMDEKYFAYRNSGLHAIESAIIDFSDKYALYNKCKNASDYLSKAIELLDGYMTETEAEKEKFAGEIELQMSEEHRSILNKLEVVCKEKKEQFNKDYSNKLTKRIKYERFELEKGIQKELNDINDKCWKEFFKGKIRNEWVQEAAAREINKLLEEKTKNSCNSIRDETKDTLSALEEGLKSELVSIILNSKNLTEEERGLLAQEIQGFNFNYNNAEKINIYDAYFWGIFFNPKNAKEAFIKKYKESIGNFNDDIKVRINEIVNDFVTDVKACFNKLIEKYNPEICGLNSRLEKLQGEILNLREQKEEIKKNRAKAETLIKPFNDDNTEEE